MECVGWRLKKQGGVCRVEGVGVEGGRVECVGWRLKKQGGV